MLLFRFSIILLATVLTSFNSSASNLREELNEERNIKSYRFLTSNKNISLENLESLKDKKCLLQKELGKVCQEISFLEESIGEKNLEYSPSLTTYDKKTLMMLDLEQIEEIFTKDKIVEAIVTQVCERRKKELDLMDQEGKIAYEKKKQALELEEKEKQIEKEVLNMGQELITGLIKTKLEIEHRQRVNEEVERGVQNLFRSAIMHEEQRRNNNNCNII